MKMQLDPNIDYDWLSRWSIYRDRTPEARGQGCGGVTEAMSKKANEDFASYKPDYIPDFDFDELLNIKFDD